MQRRGFLAAVMRPGSPLSFVVGLGGSFRSNKGCSWHIRETRMMADDGRSMVLGDLRGKRVLVTGSGGGLGKSMAEEFGRQGCRVAVHYFTREKGAEDTVKRCKELGAQEVVMHRADLRSETALDQLFEKIEGDFGGLDVLVNNAGLVLKGTADDCDSKIFDDIYAVNVRAPYLLMRHASRVMRRDGGGVIINNTSIHATQGAVEYMSAYAMTKGALNALTQSLSSEFAPKVRVLAIAPGVVPVERTAPILGKEESKSMWIPHLPIGRYGDPIDIARTTAFMASSASAWTSGSIVTVDGGMTARMNMPNRPKPSAPPQPSPVQHPET